MNKKNFLLVILLAIMLFIAGCSSGTDSRGSSFGSGSSSGTSGSGSGLELSFAQGNPPSEMFKGQPYTFAFVIKNLQEHDITDLQIRTKGFDRGFVSGLAESYSVSNVPRASSIGPGLYTGLIAQGVTVDGFVGNFNFNPEFEMRYSAKTNFRQQICVPSQSNTCDVDVTSSLYSNGPVTVKVSHINALGSTIRVDFDVTNSGKGDVIGAGDTKVEYTAPYQVQATLGTARGTCTPSGTNEFLIAGNKGSFNCEFQRTSDSSYASQLSVELDYQYIQELKLPIRVRDLNQGLN